MIPGRRFGPTLEAAGVLALAAAAIQLALLPLGVAVGNAPGPDLVFALLAAWVVRRPAEAPMLAIVAVGLAADLFLSRPLGLGALALLLSTVALRTNAASLGGGPFLAEWLTVASLAAAAALSVHAALALVFLDGPGLGTLLGQAAATALAYPLVVAFLAVTLGLRAPRRGRPPDPLGRIR